MMYFDACVQTITYMRRVILSLGDALTFDKF
jgi:hypothetical protein